MIETSGHMPECPWPTEPCSHTPMQDREPLLCMDCLTECICDRLAAYYYRVIFKQESTWRAKRQLERSAGYKRGLDAAREAVWALMDDGSDRKTSRKKNPDEDYYWAIDDATAAIDALREEHK